MISATIASLLYAYYKHIICILYAWGQNTFTSDGYVSVNTTNTLFGFLEAEM